MTDGLFFDSGFEALTGHVPMPWQRRLFTEFHAGRIPDALDLPTGLGKTSVMASTPTTANGKPIRRVPASSSAPST